MDLIRLMKCRKEGEKFSSLLCMTQLCEYMILNTIDPVFVVLCSEILVIDCLQTEINVILCE